MTTTGINGITEASLWAAWKEVRRQLRRAPQRDVLDYLEYDIDPSVWIRRLLKRISSGEYTPERPVRCSVAKSKGFDRIITIPSVPDLVLYRTIVDYLYRRAKTREPKHVYFSQATLSKVTHAAQQTAAALVDKLSDGSGYEINANSVFLEWLEYDQYRKLLIFEKLYPFIVITDITNFFDSVLYARIEESLYGLRAPTRMVSLLFHILESFSLREAMTPVQRIGLPVDPCDSSRVLAHTMLFPHDRRMVDLVGEEAYVRWMDDQNFGVSSKAEGLRVLSGVCDSLRKIHLTPNSSKSRILSLSEARIHFHFEANAALDVLDAMPFATNHDRVILRKACRDAWKSAVKREGQGEWQKILRRFYRYAARARSRIFLQRAEQDVLKMPALVDRVVDYLRYVTTPNQFFHFVERLLVNPEQIYKDVSYQLVDGLLRISPDDLTAKKMRAFGKRLLSRQVEFSGSEEARSLAPLLLLRYGDGNSLTSLAQRLSKEADSLPQELTRSLCAVVGGAKKKGFSAVQKAASKLLRNHLSDFVKLVIRIKKFDSVPGRFKARVSLTKDSITSAPLLDMRAVLAARILGLSGHKAVRSWLADTKAAHLAAGLSAFDQAMLLRLWPKDDHAL